MAGLSDLDELLLNVRDKTSKLYINEAILSYRSGAYRAAVVSNWIAVTFDIITKIRELSEQGDKQAISDIQSLEKYIEHKQIPKLQEFENSLLAKAELEYNFITNIELKELERLKEDRNLCAHPAMADSGLLYQPTAELVKTHIVHSILYLLQNQPTQGRAALSKIIEDTEKPSFPTNFEDTRTWLNTKYLDRAKPALIKNLIQALIQGFLQGETAKRGKTLQVLNTLKVLAIQNTAVYHEEQNEILGKVADNLTDDQLVYLIQYLTVDNLIWSKLSEVTRIRLKNFLQSQNENSTNILQHYTLILQLDMPDLKTILEDMKVLLSIEITKRITRYGDVGSYEEARIVGENEVLPYVSYFSAEDTKNIIDAIINNRNNQILFAAGSEAVIEAIYDGTINFISETLEDWQQLLLKKSSSYSGNDYINLRHKITKAEEQILAAKK